MKNLLINIYKFINTLNILLIIYLKKNSKQDPILYVNGARPGSTGGPKVKIQRLIKIFNISRYRPNIFYCLSNCIYTYNFIIQKYVKFKIPIIYNQNGIFHNIWYKGNVYLKNKEMKFYLLNADFVFYQSDFCKQCCDQIIYKRSKNFKILYNAVDTNFFIPGDAKENSVISILKVGIYNRNNVWRLFDTIKAIYNVKKHSYKLSIIGPIEKKIKKELEQLINQYKMNEQVSILGEVEQNNIVGIMQKHHMLLTTKIYDPCSNTIIEAMSCGLPVVFHNSGGNYELVKNAGWSFGKKNKNIEKIEVSYKDIISTLENIKIDEISKKSKLARYRAKKYFDTFKWEKEHRKVFEYYLKNNKT
jgi:glycosyltransferase involved in cell wall biosynthesis